MSARKTVAKSNPTKAGKPDKSGAKPKKASKTGGKAGPGIARARKAAKEIGKVLTAVKGDGHDQSDLFSELENLAKYIKDAKKEISALRPEEVREDFLPRASNELDAIIEATADATNAIMDATEIVDDVVAHVDSEQAEKLTAATTAIYEACTFQDITGQRITKVVNTLQDIEAKVEGLIQAFDDGGRSPEKNKTKAKKEQSSAKKLSDEDLLNGPQSTSEAKSQAEIDALLDSFD